MAQVKSVEMDRMTATPVTVQKANAIGGKIRSYPFTFHTAAADAEGVGPVASGDTVVLTRLPSGAKVVGGQVSFGVMGTGATAIIGTTADTDRYSGTLTTPAAGGVVSLANTDALFHGEELTADTDIILTGGGATYATTTKEIIGYIFAVLT